MPTLAKSQTRPEPPTDLRVDGQPARQLPVGDLVQDAQTPEQIALYLPITGALDESYKAAVRFRLAPTGSWKAAPELWRIEPEYAAPVVVEEAFAGVIFGLEPGQFYDVEVTLSNGSTTEVRTGTFATRTLPRAASGSPVIVTNQSQLQAAIDAAKPGTVIQIPAGTTIELSSSINIQKGVPGTADNPIFIRGENRQTSKIVTTSARAFYFIQNCSHYVVENLTIQGAGVDLPASIEPGIIDFWSGAVNDYCCFRRLTILGTNKGITFQTFTTGHLIYDCVFRGNNSWVQGTIESNATWNDDGVYLAGSGHCVFNCEFYDFGDTIGFANGTTTNVNKACFIYRNKIVRAGDDGIEAEYTHRNIGIYDNYILNAMTALSVDGIFGGPVYYFRNRAINLGRTIIKCGANATGVLIWSNTFVKTTGRAASPDGVRGWYWSAAANMYDWEYRNNLFLWEGDDDIVRFDEPVQNFSPWVCTHNGWGRNGRDIEYASGPATGSVAQVRAALSPIHDNDIEISNQAAVFVEPVVFGANYLTRIDTEYSLALKASAEARGKGLVIPTISESGDIGAYGYGETAPVIGDRT